MKIFKKIILIFMFLISCVLFYNNVSNATDSGFKSFNNAPRMSISTNDKKYDDVTILFTDYNGLDTSNIKIFSMNDKNEKQEIPDEDFIVSKAVNKVQNERNVQYKYVISNKYLNQKNKKFYVYITDNSGKYFASYFRICSKDNRYKVDYAPRIKKWAFDGKNVSFIARDLAGVENIVLYDQNDNEKEVITITDLKAGDTKKEFELSKFKEVDGKYKIKIYAKDKSSVPQKALRIVEFSISEKDNNIKEETNTNTIGEVIKRLDGKDVKLPEGDKVYFLDTQFYRGYGKRYESDAFIIESNGKYGMIDTGTSDKSSRVVKYLKELNIKELEFVLITHPHSDHIGGYKAVNKQVKIKKLYIKDGNTEAFKETKTLADKSRN